MKSQSNKSVTRTKKTTPRKKTTGTKKKAPKKKTTVVKKSGAKKQPTRGKKTATVKKKTTGVKKTTAAKKKTSGKKKIDAKKKTTIVKKTGTKKKAAATKKKTTGKKKAQVAKKVPGKKKLPAKKKPAGKKTRESKSPLVKAPFRAYCGGKPYVFISYSHNDMKNVFNIIKQLHKSGYRIWYDEGIEPGQEWPEIIGSRIVKCKQFLLFMSPFAAKSRNVRNELYLASDEKKEIIVVFLEKTRLLSGIKLQIGTSDSINKYDTTSEEFLKALRALLKK
jgi:hypothetical protein